jgi:hypothetical protein
MVLGHATGSPPRADDVERHRGKTQRWKTLRTRPNSSSLMQ